jgi:hypothetical protein
MKGQRRQSFILLLTSLALLIALVGGIWNSANAFVVPTFSIVSVQVDQTVTIQTANFPANDTFNVLMNVIHTQGVGGTLVTTVNSGSGGVLSFTFNIPDWLKGQRAASPSQAPRLLPGLPLHRSRSQPSRSSLLLPTARSP